MELVYPIYLDTPMMTAFLASLEGGISDETLVESKSADAKENTRSASFGAKLSGLLSSLADVEARGEIARTISENLLIAALRSNSRNAR